MCFVHGSDIREDKEILPDEFGRPGQVLSGERLQLYRHSSDSRVRHYLWVRVRDWGNDLVVSYFLRCALRGTNLFVEIKRFLLTPLADQYRAVDALGRPNWRSVAGLIVLSLIAGPLFAIYSGLVILGKINRAVARFFGSEERHRRRTIEESPLYNFGVNHAVRERLSSDRFVHYFQKLDGDFYSKVLESAILDSIVTFLADRNIDTSEVKERRTTILNSGIIVQGGDVKAESLAVGHGAQAVKHTAQRVPKILTKGA
jgi:hypothetical protein